MRGIAAVLVLLGSGGAGPAALAQHATGADIENGGRAYETSCAPCHGPDGNLIAGIDFGHGVFRRDLSDDEIVGIIQNGIPNTPMPPMANIDEPQAHEIVAYLRSLPATATAATEIGSPERGREIVMGRGQCLDCHQIGGRGSLLGPDLDRIGLDRRASEIEQSLLEPAAEVQPEDRFFSVRPRRGDPVTGRLLNQDTFTVQMLDEDERLRSFSKADLRDFGFVDTPMPAYGDRLDAQSVADVVSYLVTLRGEAE